MSAAMLFLILSAAAWLAVAGSTLVRVMRPRPRRQDIRLLARAGLLIWFTGITLATFAEVRHWPASELARMQDLGAKGKVTGFIVLAAGLVVRRRSRRTAARTEPAFSHGPDLSE